jgi:hypothetical protein
LLATSAIVAPLRLGAVRPPVLCPAATV